MLLPGLSVLTPLDYALLCLFTAVLCVLKECLYAYRLQLLRTQKPRARLPRKTSHASVDAASPAFSADPHDPSAPLMNLPSSSPAPPPTSVLSSFLPSFLYGLNLALSYLLMLLLMTYNVGIFLLIIVATAAAHHHFSAQPDTPHPSPLRRPSQPQKGLTRRTSGNGRDARAGRGVAEPHTDDGGRSEQELDDDDLLSKECCET